MDISSSGLDIMIEAKVQLMSTPKNETGNGKSETAIETPEIPIS